MCSLKINVKECGKALRIIIHNNIVSYQSYNIVFKQKYILTKSDKIIG